MDLYCLACKKYAYRNRHKCDILSLVPVTRQCRTLADKLWDLGVNVNIKMLKSSNMKMHKYLIVTVELLSSSFLLN